MASVILNQALQSFLSAHRIYRTNKGTLNLAPAPLKNKRHDGDGASCCNDSAAPVGGVLAQRVSRRPPERSHLQCGKRKH